MKIEKKCFLLSIKDRDIEVNDILKKGSHYTIALPKRDNILLASTGWKPQQLVIVSDEKPLLGDWYIVELFKITGESDGFYLEKCISFESVWVNNKYITTKRHWNNCKKVITAYPPLRNISIISLEDIKEYVANGCPSKVMVEYNCDVIISDKVKSTPTDLHLKDNCIIMSSVKEDLKKLVLDDEAGTAPIADYTCDDCSVSFLSYACLSLKNCKARPKQVEVTLGSSLACSGCNYPSVEYCKDCRDYNKHTLLKQPINEIKSLKERDTLDLLELVCQLNSRMVYGTKETHNAYTNARKELELRINQFQQPTTKQPNEIEIENLILDKLKHDEHWSNPRNKKIRLIVEILMRECYYYGWNKAQPTTITDNHLVDLLKFSADNYFKYKSYEKIVEEFKKQTKQIIGGSFGGNTEIRNVNYLNSLTIKEQQEQDELQKTVITTINADNSLTIKISEICDKCNLPKALQGNGITELICICPTELKEISGGDIDFIMETLNYFWNDANTQLQRKDLGDIERKNWKYQLDKSKEIMNKFQR